jgi:nucleoporin NDC1
MAAATVRRSPYKDFLQPALQRRFATASLFVLAIAYLQALLLANWSSCKLDSRSLLKLETG